MERVVPFIADTGGPYKQLLSAYETAQVIETWIKRKEDAICTIRQQVWEVGHDVPYSAVDGHIKQLEEDIGGFKRLLESNEASRNHWRGLHMEAWRATVRPLKVVDLPNEILTSIFANFKDDPLPQTQIGSSSFNDALSIPDVASIRNIRLTCRAFCEVASEILLPAVDVSFTRRSLQSLEQISSHPTFSKSVRILRLHANPYNPSIANDRARFGEEAIGELLSLHGACFAESRRIEEEMTEAVGLYGMTTQTQMLKSRKSDVDAALAQSRLVNTTSREVLDNTASKTCLDPYEDQISKAIDEAQKEYARRSFERESHMDNPHVLANIIKALTQLPNVQQLCILDEGSSHWDHIFRSGGDKRFDAQKYADGMAAINPFWDLMVHGGYRNRLSLSSEPLLPLLYKMPLLLQASNENLTHLDINLPPLVSRDEEALAEHLLGLQHSFHGVKSIHIKVLEPEHLIFRAGLAVAYSLLEKLLGSPRLEVVKLEYLERRKVLQPVASIGSMLSNLPWNNLRSLCLQRFSIRVEELRQLLQNVSKRLHLELSQIILLEGIWAEALEILRGRADSSSEVVDPGGNEMINMSKMERRDFLSNFNGNDCDGWDPDLRCPGPASFYIRGGNIPNPLIRGDD